jgi:hypothetical protein
VCESFEGLVEISHRLVSHPTIDSLGSGLPAVGHGFVPHPAPQSVVGQSIDLLGQAVGIQCLHHLHNMPVQRPSPLL